MRQRSSTPLGVVLAVLQTAVFAVDFSGAYVVDICPDGKSKPCGGASFTLIQKDSRICGDHSFSTPGAGRLNEGFPGSVRGTVVGETAVLVVTSGRNNGIVLGKATLTGTDLRWQTLEEIAPGTPVGDGLIFYRGVLKRAPAAPPSAELVATCKLEQ